MADPTTLHPDYAALQDWWAAKTTEVPAILAQNGIDALWWQFELFGDGVVQDGDDLNQAIALILTTPLGSDAHRPGFSTGVWSYVDIPIPRATPFVIRESSQAVQEWEPRVNLDAVQVVPYNPGVASLSVSTTWTVVDSDVSGGTEVQLG